MENVQDNILFLIEKRYPFMKSDYLKYLTSSNSKFTNNTQNISVLIPPKYIK
jgi:hypothetical protein